MKWLRIRLIAALLVSQALAAPCAAQQPDQTQLFRASVELVRIPVRVLDSDGRFVGDLTREEFHVLDDGVPQRIATFDLIEPGSVSPRTPVAIVKERTIAPIESSPGTRIYVVLLDDYHLRPDEAAKAKSVVKTFLREHITADDRLAVMFTSGSPGQDVTSDGSLLSSAVDRLRGRYDAGEPPGIREMKSSTVVDAVRDISRGLAAEGTALRRAVLLFSPGVGCVPAAATSNTGRVPWCGTRIRDALRAAAAGNVNVYAVDPRGARDPARLGTFAESPGAAMGTPNRMRNGIGGPGSNFHDAMHLLADSTGGFSIAATENFKEAFERITLEMGQYYLLGYYATHGGGDTIHQNDIRVTRERTRAFYRRSYVAPR